MRSETEDRPAATAADELRRFDGTWELVSWSAEGKQTALPDGIKISAEIEDGRVLEQAGEHMQESVLSVDPGQPLRTIDCTMLSGKHKGATYLGVYEFAGDELRLCYALDGQPRPTDFSSVPGGGHYLAVFRRVRPRAKESGVRLVMRWLFGLLFLAAGANHFFSPDFYVAIMPPYLPWHLALVYLSGVAEMALGGLLLVRCCQRLAAWGLIALLIAVFPANIHMTLQAEPFTLYQALLLVRLPLQAVLIAWAYWFTIKVE
jgi:uncharacterized protein (TIGR03067 family)